MRPDDGEEVELTALGCGHERSSKRVRLMEERVDRLNELLRSAG